MSKVRGKKPAAAAAAAPAKAAAKPAAKPAKAAAAPAKGAAKPVAKGAKGAAKPAKKKSFVDTHSHLFSANARVFTVGRDIQPKRDLSRFVKWPRYVRIQRQRAILKKRVKVPPAINQFTRTADKNLASNIFKLFAHYRPETREQKQTRLRNAASAQVKGKEADPATKPKHIKFGLNHVTTLVEQRKAKLVVIAHDVDPIELVVWLPALCRKMDVPYVIVKSKARLGHLVHQKTASALAITEVRKEDQAALDQLVQAVRPLYNDNAAELKRWGGKIMGIKRQHVVRKQQKILAREAASRS